jgi:hypothetical protein
LKSLSGASHAWQHLKTKNPEVPVKGKDPEDSLSHHHGGAQRIVKAEFLVTVFF